MGVYTLTDIAVLYDNIVDTRKELAKIDKDNTERIKELESKLEFLIQEKNDMLGDLMDYYHYLEAL